MTAALATTDYIDFAPYDMPGADVAISCVKRGES